MNRLLNLSAALLMLAACPAVPEPGPDAGDAGSPDAGLADGGQRDDGGQPDAGPLDGGTGDAGALNCDEATYDAILGTAQVGDQYRVVDSAVLPLSTWLPVAVLDELLPDAGLGLAVYGYAGDGRVHRLGTWPQLAAPATANLQFDAVSSEDRALQVLTTPLLPTTHGQLLAGYRTIRSGGFAGGAVSIFDTGRPDAGTQWFAAPGIESAAGLGSLFLVGSDALGGADGGRGVYSLDPEGLNAPRLIATYPAIPNENVRPGLMTLTANGVAVLGYYLDGASRHSLRLPAPFQLSAALRGGPALDLAAIPELTEEDDVANVVGFGSGVAVLHTRKAVGILPALGRLERYELTRAGGDAGIIVGTPETVLSADDQGCTAVSQLVPVTGGQTVIVGLWDRNGQRLVRLAPR